MVSYPLTIYGVNTTIDKIETKKEFEEKFDDIVTPRITRIVKEQKFEDLHFNSGGVWLGLGDLWYSGICATSEEDGCKDMVVKIVQLNHVGLE